MTYRHPAVYAAEAITIDHASNGRLELAYGAAWYDKEHTELGIPFPPLKERVDAFEEAVQIVRGLLTTDGVHVRGPALPGARRDAAPASGAAAAPADLDRRVGREAHDADRGALRRRVALLRSARVPREEVGTPRARSRRRAGRDPGEIRRAASLSLEADLDGVARMVDAWEAAGFDYLVCGWPSEGRELVERFAQRILG